MSKEAGKMIYNFVQIYQRKGDKNALLTSDTDNCNFSQKFKIAKQNNSMTNLKHTFHR